MNTLKMHFIKDRYIQCRYLNSHFAKAEQEAKDIQPLKNATWNSRRIPNKLGVNYIYNKFLRLASLLTNRAFTWISIELGSQSGI